jgi:glucose-1-phosphate thymidylyltransferase
VTGIYMYDATVFDKIHTLVPSRGAASWKSPTSTTPISAKGTMSFSFLDGWWTDAGTFESLLRASNLVSEQKKTAPESSLAVVAE